MNHVADLTPYGLAAFYRVVYNQPANPGDSSLIFTWSRGESITTADPLDEITDGRMLRDLIAWDQMSRREEVPFAMRANFTDAQRRAVSEFHSAQLRAKVAAHVERIAIRQVSLDLDADDL